MILLINLLTGRTEYNIYCRKSLFHQCVNLSQVLTKRFFQNNIPFIKHIHPFQITHQCYRSLWHVRTLYNIVFHNSDNRTKVIFAIFQILTPYLAARGKKLYSFTAVPEEKERARIPGQYAVEDERSSVELVRRFHGNLEPEYLVTNRGDLLAENRRLWEVLEVPCKAVLNLPWMYESYRLAAQKDCGILLSGQYGNITISYGDFRSLFLTLLHQGRIKELVREINVYSRKYRRSRKWIWRDLLTAEAGGDHEAVSRYMYDKSALRQIGEYEVKLSLATGVVPRDPTRDKRLIALVLSLPVEQFTHAGQERRLVRQYLQGKIPEEILADEFHKGRQGVGSGELLALQWERICEELSGIPGETMSGENGHSKADMVRGFYVGLAQEYRRRFEV